MAYKVIDLFAGVGGLSYGFAQDDDFEIIAANEILGFQLFVEEFLECLRCFFKSVTLKVGKRSECASVSCLIRSAEHLSCRIVNKRIIDNVFPVNHDIREIEIHAHPFLTCKCGK